MIRTIIGWVPVSFFLREANPAILQRGTGEELAGFIHLQQRDGIRRPSRVASHASATLSKNVSQSVSSPNSNGPNLRLACFTSFCFRLTMWTLSSCRISIVHSPVQILSDSLEVGFLCWRACPVFEIRFAFEAIFCRTFRLMGCGVPSPAVSSASSSLSSGGRFTHVTSK